MPEASLPARDLARRALLQEAGEHTAPATLAEAAERAYARLGRRLAVLIGATGYTVLAARALRLAQAEIPALEGVAVDAGAETGLNGLRAFALASGDATAAADGLVALLARIVDLLITFIGEDLALRLVRDAWPEPADDRAVSEEPF